MRNATKRSKMIDLNKIQNFLWRNVNKFIYSLLLYLIILILANITDLFKPAFASTIVLSITLVALILYARDTHIIAKMNEEMAKLTKTSLEKSENPLISCTFRSIDADLPVNIRPRPFKIIIVMQNHKPIKTKVKIELIFKYKGSKIPVTDSLYNGKREWSMNPLGLFQGNYDLKKDLDNAGIDTNIIIDENKSMRERSILNFVPIIQYYTEDNKRDKLYRTMYYFDFADMKFYPHPEEVVD
ncbi:MAG: hypothetical protein JSU85_14315 [Candidatus Zixiibacteriota bacterium]|nr:MAG: hypothetical protein JSU85_14315 [candidate division Zixibacteria bacterium]